MRKRVFLAAVGDANDPVTWSGIPYHFLEEGKRQGLIDEGLALACDSWPFRTGRLAWNLWRLAGLDRPGGFQYSIPFLEALWIHHRHRVRGGVVINCFQLFPPSLVRDSSIEKWIYVDQTLTQLFDHYGLRGAVGRRIAAEAIARERETYESCRGIIAHSNWHAASLINDYGIPRDRISVAVPGANLNPQVYGVWERDEHARSAPSGSRQRPLRLVFVGKDWHRKGLDRLLRALACGRAKGLRAMVTVIGCPRHALPAELQALPDVTWVGFLDKRRDPSGFIRTIADHDVGCLLSRAEAGGIGLREYHALGLAVLGTTAGGAPEHMIADAAVAVPPSAPAEAIAQELLALDRDRDRLSRLRAAAWQRRSEVSWAATFEKLRGLWPISACSCDRPPNGASAHAAGTT